MRFPLVSPLHSQVKKNPSSSWAACHLLVYTLLSLKTTGWHTWMTLLLYWCLLSVILPRRFKKIILFCVPFPFFYLFFLNIIGIGLCSSLVNPFLCLFSCVWGKLVMTHIGSDISIECDRIFFTYLVITSADPGDERMERKHLRSQLVWGEVEMAHS